MKKIVISVLIILLGLYTKADIAPNPIRAKGITVFHPTDIRMIYEKVTVDLTLDSSFVHCYFRMHNEGKATEILIGYPNMSNYSNNNTQDLKIAPLTVFENGRKLNDLLNNENSGRTWYLWETKFERNETKEIIVTYSLPHGTVKGNLYYNFNYLLSTGAGWKGKVGYAEIIVNLKDFDKDLILKASPANFTLTTNQIVWKYKNLEPTLSNDISISFEKQKGQYEERLNLAGYPKMILDNKTILSNDIRESNRLANINPNELASITVLKPTDSTTIKFPHIDCSNGLILLYSKRFAINVLAEIIEMKYPDMADDLRSKSVSYFENKVSLRINDKIIKNNMTGKIMSFDKNSVLDVYLKKIKNKNKEIEIRLK